MKKYVISACLIICFSLLFVSCKSVSYFEEEYSGRSYKLDKKIDVKEHFYLGYLHTNVYTTDKDDEKSPLVLVFEKEIACGDNKENKSDFGGDDVLFALRVGPGFEFALNDKFRMLTALEFAQEIVTGTYKVSNWSYSYLSLGFDGRAEGRLMFGNSAYFGFGGRFGIAKAIRYDGSDYTSDDYPHFTTNDVGAILKYGGMITFGHYF